MNAKAVLVSVLASLTGTLPVRADDPPVAPGAESSASDPRAALLSRLRTMIGEARLEETVRRFAIDVLLPLAANDVFAEAAREQNARKVPLERIREVDAEWQKAEAETPAIRAVLESPCAAELKRVIERHPAVVEAFVMDDQGALVGATNLTSDYWQGDEAKWKSSYREGSGGVDVGELKFDRSAGAVLQQVSLPIVDKGGRVIGAVTFGISTEKV